MTAEMIELNIFNKETLTRTTVHPFAWFHWPMDILGLVSATVKASATGIGGTGGKVKRVIVNSPTGRITERATVVETSALTPILYHTTFNDPDDFKQAMKRQ